MKADLANLVSMTEANQNFSRVARMVDERGPVVVLRNNRPAYVVLDYDALMLRSFHGGSLQSTHVHTVSWPSDSSELRASSYVAR